MQSWLLGQHGPTQPVPALETATRTIRPWSQLRNEGPYARLTSLQWSVIQICSYKDRDMGPDTHTHTHPSLSHSSLAPWAEGVHGVIHLWANTSAWWWAVQSKAFSRDGDTDRRQSRGMQRPTRSISKWRVGYHWQASTVSMAHTSHELRGRTVRSSEDSAKWVKATLLSGASWKTSLTAEGIKSPASKGFSFISTRPSVAIHSAGLPYGSFPMLFLNGLQIAAIQRWGVNKDRARNKQTEWREPGTIHGYRHPFGPGWSLD